MTRSQREQVATDASRSVSFANASRGGSAQNGHSDVRSPAGGHPLRQAATCRCHRPLSAPEGRHWWPRRDAEPDSSIEMVAVHGEDPWFLHRVRMADGWRTHGAGSCYAESSPARPWAQIGTCWAGADHPVVDVTGWDTISDSAEKLAHQQEH